MKNNIIISAILMVIMIISPLVNMKSTNNLLSKSKEPTETGYISVIKTENGKISKVTDREYLIGVLSAETDLQYADEALKAQVIAAYTYAQYIKSHNTSANENSADISDDSATNQGYFDEKQRRENWGDNYDEKEKRAEKIVDSVLGKTLTYNGELIKSVYFELSCGKTMDSGTVWGEDLPYLKSVQSPGDKLSPDYSKTVIFTDDEFNSIVEDKIKITVANSSKNLVSNLNKDDNGYVKDITVNGEKISGNDFRNYFNLNSAVFTVDYSDNGYTIKTYGKGHMVGMSQYGADYMAKQGADYEEILKHYYTGVNID